MIAQEPVIPEFGRASDCVRENRTFCWDWVEDHWGDTLQPALVQHLELMLIAVGIGFVISFALALLAHRVTAVEHPVGVLSALLYTIPSLALFQLLVPFTGIGTVTVEIALVAYTLLLLYPNLVLALRAAPPDVLEAARGMGLTRRETLLRVELPLAVPAIVGGLRIAVVSTISIATIAAFLLPKGLGYPLFLALKSQPRPFSTEIFAAGALAVGLALACDAALLALRRVLAPWSREDDVTLAETFRPGTFADALQFIADNPGLLAEKAVEQLTLAGAALGLAILVALPAGIMLGHLHRGGGLAVGASIVGRALPSLVLIGVFVAVLGIGFANNMLALAVLATGPILTNAYDGIDGVDSDVVDAARGMGMSRRQLLWRIELPLGVPLVFAGIRIAAVTVVATAPIAAIAGGGGLGDIIVNQASYRLRGVLGASLCVMALSVGVWLALLALQRAVTPRGVARGSVGLAFERGPKGVAMIRKHNRRAAKAAFAISLAVAIVIGLSACGGDDGGGSESAPDDAPTIVLGSKNFPEQFILGELYKQALEAKGYEVEYKENIGSTELIHTALEDGELNMYPEYTGVIVQVVHGQALSAETAEATYDLAKELEAEDGLTLLEATPFYDTDAIAVLNETAEEYGLETVGDLKDVPNLTLAGFPEFETRNTGLVGLRNSYGITDVDFVPLAGISPYSLLDSGDVLAAAVFSTDPPLGEGSDYTLLEDTEHVFGFQNVAPIVKTDVYEQAGDAFEDAVNAVSEKLTNDAIIAMNRAVIVDQQDPADVARSFLEENGLLEGDET